MRRFNFLSACLSVLIVIGGVCTGLVISDWAQAGVIVPTTPIYSAATSRDHQVAAKPATKPAPKVKEKDNTPPPPSVAENPNVDAGAQKVRLDSFFVLDPQKSSVQVSTGLTEIVKPTRASFYTNWCIFVHNAGGVPLKDLQLQVSVDKKRWTADLGWVNCDQTAPGALCVQCWSGGAAYPWIRVMGLTATSSVTIEAWFTANRG